MNFIDATKSGLKGYVDFNGRATRSEYWWFYLFLWVTLLVANVMDALLGTPAIQSGIRSWGLIYIVFSLGLFLPGLSVAVRRLHDRDRSGAWLLIAFVPIIGILVLIIWFVKSSDPGTNRYG